MKRVLFAYGAVLCLLLGGCHTAREEIPAVRVITGIHVTASSEGQVWQKNFTDDKKMEAILYCLRRLRPGKIVEITPESFRTQAYEITVTYSDGQKTVYRQLHNQYMQRDQEAYREIAEGPASELAGLLAELSGDHSMYS